MVKYRARNEKLKAGSITIWFLLFLPIVITLCILLLLVFGHTEAESHIRKACYIKFFRAQKKTSGIIDRLLALNPKSTKLKTAFIQAQRELQLAIAAENPVAIAAATQQIIYITNLRKILELQQKSLIGSAAAELENANIQIATELNSEFKTRNLKQKSYLNSMYEFKFAAGSKPGVLPVSADLAPNYKLHPQIESLQKLKLEWKKSSIAGHLLAKFVRGKFEENKSCSIYAKQKDQKWYFEIEMDKFW